MIARIRHATSLSRTFPQIRRLTLRFNIMDDRELLAAIRKGMSEIKKGRARRFDAAALDRLFGTSR